jgi:hypothetical protein
MRTCFTTALVLSGLLLPGLAFSPAEKSTPAEEPNKIVNACNFQASFMTWDFPPRKDPRPHARHNIPNGNKARIQLDALIDVINEETGASERFVLITPCRTEWVYAENKLFQIPSGEYRCIFSLKEERSMGRSLTFEGEVPRGRPITDTFRSLAIDVKFYGHSRELKTAADICAGTAQNVPLIGRTEIRDPKRKERYVLEYPIKTMNFRPETPSFQVDTGPLLVPDFRSQATALIDRLEMAHVAYNRLDRAEFILRRPTPILDKDGKERSRVLHYFESQEYPARNQVLTGEGK